MSHEALTQLAEDILALTTQIHSTLPKNTTYPVYVTDEAYVSKAGTEMVTKIDRVVHGLEDLLITHSGRLDPERVERLKQYGIHVRAGESDSFGLLTAIAQCQNLAYVFG